MANPKKKPRDLCDILDELLDSFEMMEHETSQAEKEELEKLAKKQEDFDNAATDMRMMYESFLDAGFDERQAFQLLCDREKRYEGRTDPCVNLPEALPVPT